MVFMAFGEVGERVERFLHEEVDAGSEEERVLLWVIFLTSQHRLNAM